MSIEKILKEIQATASVWFYPLFLYTFQMFFPIDPSHLFILPNPGEILSTLLLVVFYPESKGKEENKNDSMTESTTENPLPGLGTSELLALTVLFSLSEI